jgi:hypothetical protein
MSRLAGALVVLTLVGTGAVMVTGQQQALPGEPQHQFGASITPAFEGWFTNKDGSHSFLIGYYNRNQNQELDIPIGPDNHFEPGPPDRGQPTHFLPGRQWGMFSITVPKDFPPKQEITWVLNANGQGLRVPFYLHTDYEIEPLTGIQMNTPPVMRFAESGPSVQGPLDLTIERQASMATPLPLTVWLSDDLKTPSAAQKPPANRDPVTIGWAKYRGPGKVTFDPAKPKAQKTSADGAATFAGTAATSVKFSEPGDYTLQVTINDYSGVGGGGFQCCWTTGLVKVTVKP